MAQLKYALIARDDTVLCDFSNELGAFRSVTVGLLERIPSRTDRVSFPYDGNLYSFAVESGYVFAVVGVETKKTLAFGFLEKIKAEFLREYGAHALEAGPGALDATFGDRLRYWMNYCSKNPEEMGRLGSLQRKVDDIKTIMLSNIEEVIARGEKLQDLDDKADALAFDAESFNRSGQALRKRMWWKSKKWQIVLAFVVLIILAIIALVIYNAVKK